MSCGWLLGDVQVAAKSVEYGLAGGEHGRKRDRVPLSDERYGDLAEELSNKGWGVIPATDGKATRIPWKRYQREQPNWLERKRWREKFRDGGVMLPFGPVNDCVIGVDNDEDDGDRAAGINETIAEVLGPSPVIRVGRWPRT